MNSDRNLGSMLNQLLDALDQGVQGAYRADGLDYRPRYTPVMRTLAERGPCSIRAIASAAKLTHSATSQTVAQMARAGLVRSAPGEDARERVVALTGQGQALLPRLRRHWATTARAIGDLDAELGVSLEAALADALAALERTPFDRRLDEARVQLEAIEDRR